MPDALRHPATGDPIELGPDERLCRVAGPGPVVLAVVATRPTYRAPEGEPAYRLAAARCQTWNPVGALRLEPWSEPSA